MWPSRTKLPTDLCLLAIAAVVLAGCSYGTSPRIDPSGQYVFADPGTGSRPYRSEPGQPFADDDIALSLSPVRTVAPVGSEVVLLAGVMAGDGYLRTNRRLEWSLAAGSVGNFVAVGENTFVDWFVGDFNRPRKLTNTYAIGSTSRRYLRLDRGTPSPTDDVCVARGQGWISITSPVEGTSQVVAHAPEVIPWDGRTRSALIHWVDAQVCFPPPAVNAAGSRHLFTTTVLRQTTNCPHAGWLVRYEIVGGPPAGFAPDGSAAIEVPTNAAGQATAEIFQKAPAHGTNQIRIQVIRPALAGQPGAERLVVGNGSTLKTWTAAAISVRKRGPTTAALGSTVAYRLEVTNPGDLSARQVTVTDDLPDGLTFVSSTPAPTITGRRLQWRLGDLGPRQRQAIDLSCRITQQGSIANCVEVAAAGGLKANDCATTTVMSPSVDVSVTSPPQAAVGSRVTFQVTVTNRSPVKAAGLLIKARFDAGLEHDVAKSPIEKTLGDLAPGESQKIGVTFRVSRAGRLCTRVEVLASDGVRASNEGCVMGLESGAVVAPGPSVDAKPEPPKPPLATESPALRVRKIGPAERNVGQTAEFTIDIANTGNRPLTNLQVVDTYDRSLRPLKASDGYRLDGNTLAWTLPSLGAGKSIKLQVNCQCLTAAAQVCNRVAVTCQEGFRSNDEVCVTVRPAIKTGALALSVADLQNPVSAGRPVTYLIRVTNGGGESDRNVAVTVTLPPGLAADRFGTSGPGDTKYTIEGGLVRFTPAVEIKPGETLTYRVKLQTRQAGQVRLHVEVVSQDHPQPLVGEKTTEVFPASGT